VLKRKKKRQEEKTLQRNKTEMTADIWSELVLARRQHSDMFKAPKEKPVSLEFCTQRKYLSEIKVKSQFLGQEKLTEFIASRPTLKGSSGRSK